MASFSPVLLRAACGAIMLIAASGSHAATPPTDAATLETLGLQPAAHAVRERAGWRAPKLNRKLSNKQ